MDGTGQGGQSNLASPFSVIVDPNTGQTWAEPEARLNTITREVLKYLQGGEESTIVGIDADNEDSDLLEEPEALTWYYRVKEWGLPRAGGFLDQPIGFMEDIWAAEKAIKQNRAIQMINERLRNQFQDNKK